MATESASCAGATPRRAASGGNRPAANRVAVALRNKRRGGACVNSRSGNERDLRVNIDCRRALGGRAPVAGSIGSRRRRVREAPRVRFVSPSIVSDSRSNHKAIYSFNSNERVVSMPGRVTFSLVGFIPILPGNGAAAGPGRLATPRSGRSRTGAS